MREDFPGNRWLDIGGLRLDALIADGRKLAEFVCHAALLTAHAEPARLAGVFGSQRLGRIQKADTLDGIQRIQDFLAAAPDGFFQSFWSG